MGKYAKLRERNNAALPGKARRREGTCLCRVPALALLLVLLALLLPMMQ
jgi:hypothetical protein